ncbi:MAG: 16S rRNA (guanine(527)-N(7))-methyltransferase RsmG [Phycisphaerae bacterium]
MTHAEVCDAGFAIERAAHARLEHFIALLLAENERANLTAARDAATLWRAHVLDSLALMPQLREARVGRLIDVGCGGGLPGLPLACALPALAVTLLDATGKKVAAVERIAAALGLANVRGIHARAEEAAHDAALRESFDAAVARAVAPLAVLIEYCAGFVRPMGWLWFMKTRSALEIEIPAAASAAKACGVELRDARDYALPGEAPGRAILACQRTRALDPRLPRRAGAATRRTL